MLVDEAPPPRPSSRSRRAGPLCWWRPQRCTACLHFGAGRLWRVVRAGPPWGERVQPKWTPFRPFGPQEFPAAPDLAAGKVSSRANRALHVDVWRLCARSQRAAAARPQSAGRLADCIRSPCPDVESRRFGGHPWRKAEPQIPPLRLRALSLLLALVPWADGHHIDDVLGPD